MIGKETRWVSFGASRSRACSKGTDGSTSDLIAYENALAVVEDSAGKNNQQLIGTLVQVDGCWRLADVPKAGADTVMQEGGFFFSSHTRMNANDPNNLPMATQALIRLWSRSMPR